MKIWYDPKGVQGGVTRLGIGLLAGIFLLFGGLCLSPLLAIACGLPIAAVATAAFLIVTAGLLGLAFGAARRLADLCLIFCLDDAGRLFAVNAREDMQFRRSDLFWFVRLQRRLRNMVAGGVLAAHLQEPKSLTGLGTGDPGGGVDPRDPRTADRDLRVKMPNGGTTPALLFAGEGAVHPRPAAAAGTAPAGRLPPGTSRGPAAGLGDCCAALLAGDAVVCVLCHPAVGRLPSDYYFPCWGSPLFCSAPWSL